MLAVKIAQPIRPIVNKHVDDTARALGTRSDIHHDRNWWRAEARRLGSDWPGILAVQAEVIARWRARHDPDYEGAPQ
jgi:hypothetical protein